MNTGNLHEDLAWTAYRYVAAEMPDDERTAFEELLDTDQSAREAVARVATLSEAIRALPQASFAGIERRREMLSRSGWFALGIAASLLVMATWRTAVIGLSDDGAQFAGATADPRVIMSWRSGMDDAGESEELEVPVEEITADEIETPSWLTAALLPREAPPMPTDSEVN